MRIVNVRLEKRFSIQNQMKMPINEKCKLMKNNYVYNYEKQDKAIEGCSNDLCKDFLY